MIIPLVTDLDTSRLVMMMRDLQKISGKDFEEVLKVVAGQILNFCIRNTKVADPKRIRAQFAHSDRFTFPGGEVISKSKRHPGDLEFLDTSTFKPGKNGPRGPVFIVGGKAWHDMSRWHWSDERWAKFQTFLAETEAMKPRMKGADLAAALGSVGLAKNSWWQIGEEAGIADKVKAPDYAKRAKAQNGKDYQNGRAKAVFTDIAAYIEMMNTSPQAIRMNGQTLINYAMQARATAFEREVEKGVFQDIKTRAQRYPGLFVS